MSTVSTAVLVFVVIVLVSVAGIRSGYWRRPAVPPAHVSVASSPEPSPLPTLLPTASPVTSPVPSTGHVQAAHTSTLQLTPTIKPSPSPSPQTTLPVVLSAETVSITLIDIPTTVPGGTPLTIAWRITGPAHAQGEHTTLTVTHQSSTTQSGGHTSHSINTKTSFGAFSVPKTFSSHVNLKGVPGPLHITAAAVVDGHTVTTEKIIELTS